MSLTEAIIPVRPICSANHFSKLSLVLLMLFTASLSQAQCPSPPGNPAVFGNNAWIAYGYDNADLSLSTAVYSGYYTQPTLGFDTQASWNQNSSPANTEGWEGCSLNNDSFTLVYKRKGFPCGTYSIAMDNWDDAAVLYIDGVERWSCSTGSGMENCDGYVGDIVLNENSEVEVRLLENGGVSFASLGLINNNPATPGSLTSAGSTIICANTKPSAIILGEYSGTIVKWQSASDVVFATNVIDIASTGTVLNPSDMGAIAATTYYRAVLQNGSCFLYTAPIEVLVPAAVSYSNGEWNGPLTETSPIIIEGDLLLNDDLTACSCIVKAGSTLRVGEGVSLALANSVTVETGAQLIIEDSGSLIQADDTADNIGSITVKRNSQPMKNFDYTYWSFPVQGATLFQLSPLTLSDKYYRFDPVINNWVSIPGGAGAMEAGKGYIVRAPQGWAVDNSSAGIYNAAFSGIPNNGVIPVAIQKGAGTFNLIGNPYPSAINIDSFLTDPVNAGIVNGTIYLWTHNTAISASIPGNPIYNYTADDYSKYNLTGGVRTASSAITGGFLPFGVIASGQGFFIEAATGLADGTYTANFNNKMRIAGENDNFYKTNQQQAIVPALEKNRLWITISNTQGAYNQALIGYITNATNGPDALFDGKPWAAGNVLSLYSVNGSDMYSIQGRALPFTDTDEVPLGYTTSIPGSFTLALENFDGLFQNQSIYLLDKTTNTMQDLKAGAHTFMTGAGTFNDRFEIHYRNSTLGTTNLEGSNWLIAYTANRQINIDASKKINSVAVYDLVGREIFRSGQILDSSFKTPQLNLQQQALIMKTMLEDGSVISKKVIME
ncbi:MAG: T9SS sorting signal type C domain-containing protein [Flavobacterium sp.]